MRAGLASVLGCVWRSKRALKQALVLIDETDLPAGWKRTCCLGFVPQPCDPDLFVSIRTRRFQMARIKAIMRLSKTSVLPYINRFPKRQVLKRLNLCLFLIVGLRVRNTSSSFLMTEVSTSWCVSRATSVSVLMAVSGNLMTWKKGVFGYTLPGHRGTAFEPLYRPRRSTRWPDVSDFKSHQRKPADTHITTSAGCRLNTGSETSSPVSTSKTSSWKKLRNLAFNSFSWSSLWLTDFCFDVWEGSRYLGEDVWGFQTQDIFGDNDHQKGYWWDVDTRDTPLVYATDVFEKLRLSHCEMTDFLTRIPHKHNYRTTHSKNGGKWRRVLPWHPTSCPYNSHTTLHYK